MDKVADRKRDYNQTGGLKAQETDIETDGQRETDEWTEGQRGKTWYIRQA